MNVILMFTEYIDTHNLLIKQMRRVIMVKLLKKKKISQLSYSLKKQNSKYKIIKYIIKVRVK